MEEEVTEIFVTCQECGFTIYDGDLTGTTSSGSCRCCGSQKLKWTGEG